MEAEVRARRKSRSKTIVFGIACETVSEANRASHEHWRARHRRAGSQRDQAYWLTVQALQARGPIPAGAHMAVRLTRFARGSVRAGRYGLDDDNLVSSMKHLRDGIARALRVDDRDPRVRWFYDQQRNAAPFVLVEVRILDRVPREQTRREWWR